MEKSLNICAVIVTYNTGKEITTAAESVRSKVDELVIVDNGSDSETVKQLKGLQYENKATVIYLDENKGIAKALNVAAQYALDNGYKWLLTLDDDSRVTENMITTMLQAYDGLEDSEKEKVAVIAPRHIEKGSSEYQEANKKEIELTRVLTEITSGNLVRLELLREAGYYKEEFFIDFVDHYFCLKLKRLGFDIIRVENAILLHSLGNSIPKSILGQKITVTNHSPLRRYYMTRNRLYTWKEFKKDFPEWYKEDLGRFINETIKIILYEDRKLSKLRSIMGGVLDYGKKVMGKKENR